MAEQHALPNLGVHESKESSIRRQGKTRAPRRPGSLHSACAGVQRFGQCGFHLVRADAQRLLRLATTLAFAVIGQTGTCRDQTAHHHVFLQAAQVVALAGHRGFGQHAGGFLEGCRGDERLGGQRRLGDTEQHARVLGRELVFGDKALVLCQHRGQLDLITLDEAGITNLCDLHLAQHLTQNRLDVLVVDLHTLQAVDVLDLVDDVTGQGADAQQAQDVVRIARTVGDHFTLVDLLAFEHVQVTPLGNQLLVRGAAIIRGDDQTTLALGLLAERDGATDFREDGGFLRTTGLEQVGDARQTTGDVAGLGGFLRDTRQHITHVDLRTVGNPHQRLGRQQVLGLYVGTGQQQILAVLVDQLDGRTNVLARGRTLVGIQDLDAGQAGQLVHLTADGDAFLHADEGDDTLHLGDDRVGMRVPLGHDGARLDLVAFLNGNHGTVRQLVALALATEVVRHGQFTRTGHRDQRAVAAHHVLHVDQADGAAILDLHTVRRGSPAGRTTDVEGTHGQLGTRLTDRLGGNDADRFADVDAVTAGQIATVAAGADAVAGFAGDRGTHDDLVDAVAFDELDQLLVDQGTGRQQHFLGARLEHVAGHHATQHALAQRLDHVSAFDVRGHDQALIGTAIHLGHHQVLGHVDQTTGQVTGVRGLQCGIRQTLTRTVGGDEVLQNRQTFAEVRGDRGLDDRAVRLGHQAAHAGQLADLGRATTRTGVRHHVHGVEGLLQDLFALAVDDLVLGQVGHHRLGHFVVGLGPEVDHLVVFLALGHQTGSVLGFDFLHFLSGGIDDASLLGRDLEVVHADRHAGQGRVGEAGVHQLVGEDHGVLQADGTVGLVDQLGDRLLLHRLVDDVEGQTLGHDLEQQGTADGGVDDAGVLLQGAVLLLDGLVDAHLDLGVQGHFARAEGTVDFLQVGEHAALALGIDGFTGHVVQTQHHVLGGNDDRLAVGRRQHVVGGHHQGARFQLSLEGQRHVHGHLVTVEVGVVRGAHQRVQLQRLAFDQHRLERLDTQTVQGRRTVEQHGMLADDLGENVPDLGQLALDHLLGGLDGGGQATGFQLAEDERLEQLQRHLLGQTALVQTQGRAHGDHGTAGVVDALAQQVLTEATLLALDHVGQGLQRALVGAGDGTAATTVVQQGVHGFLQHALFVAHDDVRRGQVEQALQTVVTVDDATIQIVQVGSREAATVQRNQRTQVRRQHRQHGQHHPLRLVAGLLEGFHQLQALGQLLDLGFRVGLRDLLAQASDLVVQVDAHQQLAHGLGAHLGVEVVTELLEGFEVLLVVQQLALFQGGHARVDHHVALEVEHALDVAQGHVQQQADTGRQGLQEPDVGDRRGQLDVRHALAAHLGQRHFDAALLADHATVLEALVLTAQALVVLHRAEDLGAEQAVALRLEGTVVDGFRLFHFAEGPGTDHLRRSQTDRSE